MSDSPQEFDLKFLPDWLKEAPASNQYANYEGGGDDRPRRDRDGRDGPRGNRPPDRRGPRPPQGGDRGRGGKMDRGAGDRPRGDRRPGGPGGRRDEVRPPREAPAPAPAELRVDFLPEPHAAAGIAKQIKSSGRSYAVFQTAKLFLERPERHRVRITSSSIEAPLYQIADGPISFDRALVERGAFLQMKDEFYKEEVIQGEPIKGNFTKVAYCRSADTLLGPTNYHEYQPALRRLFEERFSRRMSFPEFQQREIEIIGDEQAVADWKEQARTSRTYTTIKETEPVTFKTLFDVEQHFRKVYLPDLVNSGAALECSGAASRAALDRHVNQAVREAWERERSFPQGIVNALRPHLFEVGLHFFKHRKRMLHVTSVKPARHPEGQTFSDGISAILKTIETYPRAKRPDLAKKIIGPTHDTPEAAPLKAQMATDLHYLIQMGHVIEFADGAFDLPLGPKGETSLPAARQGGKQGGTPSVANAPAEGSPSPVEEKIGETPAEEAAVENGADGDFITEEGAAESAPASRESAPTESTGEGEFSPAAVEPVSSPSENQEAPAPADAPAVSESPGMSVEESALGGAEPGLSQTGETTPAGDMATPVPAAADPLPDPASATITGEQAPAPVTAPHDPPERRLHEKPLGLGEHPEVEDRPGHL